jgi:hypothetical protein
MSDRPTCPTEKGDPSGSENNRVGHKVLLRKGHVEEPPWKHFTSWREANHAVAVLINRHGHHLHETKRVARNLYRKTVSLFPLLEELCRATCTYCPDPCCFSAYAWFDCKDLLFAHLNGLAIPPAQLMTDGDGIYQRNGLLKQCDVAHLTSAKVWAKRIRRSQGSTVKPTQLER